MQLEQWAIRHGVSIAALVDLRSMLGMGEIEVAVPPGDHAESFTQGNVRIEAGRKGVKLFRNNVGVMVNDEGQPVRFGLANDSKKLNETIKSGDLIGWRPVIITPEMIGSRIAQFVSRECKRPGWTYSGTDREKAQAAWAAAILRDRGDAAFCNNVGTL